MPMIPIYDEPKVAPQIAPDTRIDPRILMHSPGAFGQQLGADISQVGAEINHIQDVAGQVAAQDAFNKAAPALADFHNQIMQKVGSQLVQPGSDPLTKQFTDGYTGIAAKFGTDLTGPAKFYFDKQVTSNVTGMLPSVDAHQKTQITAHTVDVLTAGNAADKDAIAKNPANQVYVDMLTSNIVHRTAVIDGLLGRPTGAEVEGITDPAATQPTDGATGVPAPASLEAQPAVVAPAGSADQGSSVPPPAPGEPGSHPGFARSSPAAQAEASHARAIQIGAILSQANPDITLARQIFEKTKPQMLAGDATKVQEFLDNRDRAITADKVADDVMAAATPAQRLNPEALVRLVKDDPRINESNRDQAVNKIKEAAVLHKMGVEADSDQTWGTLAQQILYHGASPEGLKNSTTFLTTDPVEQPKLYAKMVGLYNETKAAKVSSGAQDAAYYDMLDRLNGNPARGIKADTAFLTSKTPQQVAALVSAVGPQHETELQQMRQGLLNPQAGKPAPFMPESQIKDIAEPILREAGLISDLKSMGDNDKSLVMTFTTYIQKLQQQSGQLWDITNAEKLIREKSKKVVTNPGWFFPDTKPLFQVEQDVPTWFRGLGMVNGLSGLDTTQKYMDLNRSGAFTANPEYAQKARDIARANGFQVPTDEQINQDWFYQYHKNEFKTWGPPTAPAPVHTSKPVGIKGRH